MKNYKNKYFSILGDSISTLEGYSQPKDAVYYNMARKMESGVLTFADTWWGKTIERLEGELLVNNSISGSTVCWQPSYEVSFYGCSEERTSSLDREGITPDVIMVYLGTNDWGFGIRVSENGLLAANEKNTAVFSVAYREMLEGLKRNYPNAEIWCLTLPLSRCSARENFVFRYHYAGRNILEYNEAIRACAAQLRCRVIDLEKSEEAVDTVDGFHPNASGMTTIANAVLDALRP